MLSMITTTLEQAGSDALSTAVGFLGSRLAAAVSKPRGRRAEDIAIARWFETCKLTKSFPELPGLSAEMAARLTGVLSGDATQAALQELLAARLTDADDAEAGRAREVFCLTLATADPALSGVGPLLADYYDGEICSLVARLEADEPALLALIRSDAMSARMIAVLRAIERHTAALSGRPNLRSEASFLASYRGHVVDRHGKLEPPDFDRRRRVPIADIYVTPVIYENTFAERTVAPDHQDPPARSVWELASRLDRTVLLGDPGGGKTTASNVLMHYFASDDSRRIPFLVTLRNYAASEPPEHSVVGYIEKELETFYQCPAPPGLVDMLLLTRRAVVIFDGLDELLDTSRRTDVASRVEHFCREYPLTPVLVTSRVVGYDQARLDESQFVSYRLGGFRDADVAEYARKWFALEEGNCANDADAFLSDSESVPDLRANPLLLSLMCILYRGEGSLPRNRAEIYEQCAKLLFKRWDAHRHIHQDLRVGRYVELILRHLAWWLFTRGNTQTSVTEHDLVATTTEFLHGRGFEVEGDAREAAREFIEFCRGRMWVFNEAGTTATGEKLYAFTHRTFLEFFAASQLAFNSDTPERLAKTIAPRIARGQWEVVGELAVQLKDSTSADGARRIYAELLDERRRRSAEGRSNILQFLARTLRSVDPSPQVTRRLTREVVNFLFSGDPDSQAAGLPIAWLLASCAYSPSLVCDEVGAMLESMIASSTPKTRLSGIRLALSLSVPLWGNWGGDGPNLAPDAPLRSFWSQQSMDNAKKFQSEIIAGAALDNGIRVLAMRNRLISIENALRTPEDLHLLLQSQAAGIFGLTFGSYILSTVHLITRETSKYSANRYLGELTVLGEHLLRRPAPPWTQGPIAAWSSYEWEAPSAAGAGPIAPTAYLGAASALLISAELDPAQPAQHLSSDPTRLGAFRDLYHYIERRHNPSYSALLPELPVPGEFKQLFRDWAEGKVNFTAPGPDQLGHG